MGSFVTCIRTLLRLMLLLTSMPFSAAPPPPQTDAGAHIQNTPSVQNTLPAAQLDTTLAKMSAAPAISGCEPPAPAHSPASSGGQTQGHWHSQITLASSSSSQQGKTDAVEDANPKKRRRLRPSSDAAGSTPPPEAPKVMPPMVLGATGMATFGVGTVHEQPSPLAAEPELAQQAKVVEPAVIVQGLQAAKPPTPPSPSAEKSSTAPAPTPRLPEAKRPQVGQPVPTPESGLVDYFKLLGVSRDASFPEIRTAYLNFVRTNHPDKGGSASAFCSLGSALETLGCPLKRRIYTMHLEAQENGSEGKISATGQSHRKERMATGHRRDEALAKLKRCIEEQPKEFRNQTVEKLPADVGRALLVWMEDQRTVTEAADMGPTVESDGASSSAATTAASTPQPGSQAAAPPALGIKRAGGGTGRGYIAQMSCLNLLFTPRSAEDPDTALEYRKVLLQLREALEKDHHRLETQEATILAQRIREYLANLRSSPEALGLSLTPWLSVQAELGDKLRGQKTNNLEAACLQRERFLKARGDGWAAVREVCIELHQKQHNASQREATLIVDEAYAKRASQRKRPVVHQLGTTGGEEGRRKQRLSAAVREVEKCLSAETRESEAADQLMQKQQRQAVRREDREAAKDARYRKDARGSGCTGRRTGR